MNFNEPTNLQIDAYEMGWYDACCFILNLVEGNAVNSFFQSRRLPKANMSELQLDLPDAELIEFRAEAYFESGNWKVPSNRIKTFKQKADELIDVKVRKGEYVKAWENKNYTESELDDMWEEKHYKRY